MIDKKILLPLILFTLIASYLRIAALDKNPPSLNIDEVSNGYNAYSILKTGKDEYGNFMPLSFRSLDDYKPPVFIYSLVPSIAAFGLNEFSVRFPSALLGTLSIPLFFGLFYLIVKSRSYALVSTAVLTISSWHIFVSRVGWDYMIGLFLTVVGIYGLLKMKEGRWYWVMVASVFLALSMYAYQAPRFFVPIFILAYIKLFWTDLKNKKMLGLFATVFLAIITPLIFSFLFGPDKTRAQMTLITKDVEFVRNVAIPLPDEIFLNFNIFASSPVLLFFHWIRKILAYLQPTFLFSTGLSLTTPGTLGLGVLYLFEIPLFILGLVKLLKGTIPNKNLILIWIILGLLPASLTQNEQHYGRSLLILPMVVLITGIGAVWFFQILNNMRSHLKFIGFSIFGLLIIWNLAYAALIFSIHFPSQREEDFMGGTKEAVLYALEHKDKYDEIVFDPVRGIQGPYIVSVPHAYILFYSKYDPAKYQKEPKREKENFYGFDKFTIRPIDWREDRYKSNNLFIGSPWSLPQKNLEDHQILKKVYLKNGDLAFLIVALKKE